MLELQLDYFSLMSLKSTVDTILEGQSRSFNWLAGEMDRTTDGLRLALVNESLKYSDIKKMVQLLKVPITVLFEQGASVQNIKGNRNNQAGGNMMLSEPAGEYKRENDLLKEQIEQLKDQLADKAKIIELLTQK